MSNMPSSSDDSDLSSSYSSDGEVPSGSVLHYMPKEVEDKQFGFDDCVHSYILYPSESEIKDIVEKLREHCIYEAVTSTSCNIQPAIIKHYLSPSILHGIQSVAEWNESLIFINSPLLTFQKAAEELTGPSSAICDLFIFTSGKPVTILTFVTDTSNAATRHNAIQARTLTIAARENGYPHFHLVHGVIEESDWRQKDKLAMRLQELEDIGSKQIPGNKLTTDDEAVQNAFNLFLDLYKHRRLTKQYKDIFSRFVATAAFESARDKLQQGNILILTGGPGEGKTAIGHKLCYVYHQQGYNTVYYSRDEDINWEVLGATGPTFVVIDIRFSNVEDDNSFINDHFQKFNNHINVGRTCVKILLVISKCLKKTFKCYPTIDLSEALQQDVTRTKEDYLQMLQTSITGISEETGREIMNKLPSYVGFPKAVKLYREYKHHVDPVTYFTYPLHFFIEEMEKKAVESDLKEWVYVILCGGSYVQGQCDSNLLRCMRHLFPEFPMSLKSSEELKTFLGGYLDTELNACPYDFLDTNISTEEDQLEVHFSHPAIYDACLFVVDRKYPGYLWKHCQVLFETDEEQFHISLRKLTVFISRYNAEMFLTQIVEDVMQRKFRRAVGHGVLRSQKYIDIVFTQLGDRMKDICHAEEDSLSFLYWVVLSDNQKVIKRVLEEPSLTQTDVDSVLISCIRLNQIKSFLSLRQILRELRRPDIRYENDCTDLQGNSLLMTAVEKNNVVLVNDLVADIEEPLMRNHDNNTALHVACLRGDIEVTKSVLATMTNAKDLPGQDSRTPIMMAALKGHSQVYEYLVDDMACIVTGTDDHGDNILQLACVGGNLDIVKHLISSGKIDKNQRGQHGKTPLMVAADRKHRELFDWLLDKGCNISPYDFGIMDFLSEGHINHTKSLQLLLQSREYGTAPVSSWKDQKKLLKCIQNKGSNMLFDDNGTNLLHTAAGSGHLQLAEFLLSKGHVEINIRDGTGRTPAMLTAAVGHQKFFEFLLDKECDLSLHDETSRGILYFAFQGGNRAIIDKLMERCFTDVNSRNDSWRTPLSVAVEKGDKNLVDLALDKGGDASVVDREKNTLLHFACKGGNMTISELILSLRRCDINVVNVEHRTPLLVAAYNKHNDICQHLINEGADLHIQDWDGNDVMHIAADQDTKFLTDIILDTHNQVDNKNKSGETALMKAADNGHYGIFDALMKHVGFNLADIDNDDKNILHHASIGGSVDIVQYILSQQKIDIDSKCMHGSTAVMLAMEKGQTKIFDFLVTNGCNFSTLDENENNILHSACIGGSVNIVQYIVSKEIVDINSTNFEGKTPLMLLAETGHWKSFKFLVKIQACDLSAVDKYGYNILHAACIGGSPDIVQYVLSQDIVEFNSRNIRGKTPVMLAAEQGHREIFDLLVSKGFDLSIVDEDGDSLLHFACLGGSADIMRYIISQDVLSTNSTNYVGKTPVMLTAEKGHKRLFDLLVNAECDLSLTDHNEASILHGASTGGSVHIVRYILSQNLVGINCRDRRGRTPVMLAAEEGHRDVFELLVRTGCNLSLADRYGDTIIHAACAGGSVDIVRYVLSQKIVDINSRGRLWKTPVLLAAERGNGRVFDQLVREGCNLSVADRYMNTVLHATCTGGNISIVRYVLSTKINNINSKNQWNKTPLKTAHEKRYHALVKLLRQEGSVD